MDSRIREALEYIICLDISKKATSLTDTQRLQMAVAKARSVIAEQSSTSEEAQDCDTARDLVKHIVSIVLPNQITALISGDINRAVRLIQAYAARHARPMPDLTDAVDKIRFALNFVLGDNGFGVAYDDAMDALDRIEAVIKEARDD